MQRLRGDRAAVVAHDRVAHREPETAPLDGAHLLGRKIRVEDPVEVLLGDPGAVVGELQAQVAARRERGDLPVRELDRAGADLQGPAPGHRLAGVLDEVVDHLAHLPLVEIHGGEILGDGELAGEVRAGGREQDRLAQHPGDAADPFDRLAALGEGDELAGQVPGAQRGLGGVVEGLGGVRVRPGEEAGEVEVAEDDRQQVVEVVREAAGEHADRLELLGAHVLVLEFFLVGEVAGQPDHRDRRGPRASRTSDAVSQSRIGWPSRSTPGISPVQRPLCSSAGRMTLSSDARVPVHLADVPADDLGGRGSRLLGRRRCCSRRSARRGRR